MDEILAAAKYILANDMYYVEYDDSKVIDYDWEDAARKIAAAWAALHEKVQPETAKVAPPTTSPS